MGYSVYVRLTTSERPVVARFLEALEKDPVTPGDPWQYSVNPRMEELSYTDCNDVDGTYAGCDYGSYDPAHTFCIWMAKTLGKPSYCYDGQEEIKVSPEKKWVNTWSNPDNFPADFPEVDRIRTEHAQFDALMASIPKHLTRV